MESQTPIHESVPELEAHRELKLNSVHCFFEKRFNVLLQPY